MPTYNYLCDACHHEFEKEQRISEAPIKKCPECGKSKARRMISSGNFILKGGGWYSDGYGAGGTAKKPASVDKDSSTSASSPPPSKASDSTSSD
jgi:putative FmdB family regulatory protein